MYVSSAGSPTGPKGSCQTSSNDDITSHQHIDPLYIKSLVLYQAHLVTYLPTYLALSLSLSIPRGTPMILNTSISNSNYYHHHHRVQVQGPHQPSCFGLLGISTSSKRLSHENGFHSYNHISRSSSNCSIRLRMALFEDNGKDLEMLDMDDYDVIEECKLPPDFNAIMLKDFKCTPDDIDKKYWELLSTGSDIHRTHTATGESYNKESSVDDDTDTDTTENLSNVLEGSPEVLSTTLDQVMTLFPVVAPIFAFLTYPMLIPYFDSFVDAIATTVSTKNWLNVDGGAYQAELITPAINGKLWV